MRISSFVLVAIVLFASQPSLARFKISKCNVTKLSDDEISFQIDRVAGKRDQRRNQFLANMFNTPRAQDTLERLEAGERVKLPPLARAMWNGIEDADECLAKLFAEQKSRDSANQVADTSRTDQLIAGGSNQANLINYTDNPGYGNVTITAVNPGVGVISVPAAVVTQQTNRAISSQLSQAISRGGGGLK